MISCDVCGGTKATDTLRILKKCLSCGHIYAPLDLNLDEAKKVYSEDFFMGDAYFDYVAESISLQRNFELRNKELKPFMKPNSKSLLDVGCAHGFYVQEASNLVEDAVGIDIASSAVEYGKRELNLNLKSGDLLDYDFGKKQFDVVTMWDTIEHLNRPSAYIRKIRKLTKPSGVFAFTTGNIASPLARLRRSNWRMIHVPAHLHYFTPATARKLLEDNGFKICKIHHNGIFRTLGNISHNLFVLRMNAAFIHKMIEVFGLSHLNCYMNTFDVMTVIARKE